MGLLSRKLPHVLGVDVSSTAVKLLELSGSGDKFRVESYAVEPLPPNAVVEKNITEVEAVGEAIRRATRRSGTKNKLAALAVAGSAVITKVITMPGEMGDDEMASQIELEADQYIPYSLEEVNLDFEVLGVSLKAIPTRSTSCSPHHARKTSTCASQQHQKRHCSALSWMSRLSRWKTPFR